MHLHHVADELACGFGRQNLAAGFSTRDQPLHSAADVQKALSSVPKDSEALVLVWSNDGSTFRVLHPTQARQTSGVRRGHPLAPQPSSHAALEGFGAATKPFFRGLLWSEGVVPVDPAASKEAVPHHTLAKQKKDHC